jgi:hypothetical protein
MQLRLSGGCRHLRRGQLMVETGSSAAALEQRTASRRIRCSLARRTWSLLHAAFNIIPLFLAGTRRSNAHANLIKSVAETLVLCPERVIHGADAPWQAE